MMGDAARVEIANDDRLQRGAVGRRRRSASAGRALTLEGRTFDFWS